MATAEVSSNRSKQKGRRGFAPIYDIPKSLLARAESGILGVLRLYQLRLSRIVGDYESLLMLHDRAPDDFCPSMNPVSITQFISFKRSTKGSDLTDLTSSQNVMDVDGNVVKCQGGWNDPRNVDQCLAAVSALHSARGQRGSFKDRCNQCVELDDQGYSIFFSLIFSLSITGSYHGCRIHRGSPCLWRMGNPKD